MPHNTITELVERFERNIDAYTSGKYNETQVRREYIDPFFTALGWDVANTKGYAEQYKDVVHEDAIKVGKATKAPDYSFRIGGQRKFFLEAKKPSVNIKQDTHPAYQLRRYAWSAKLPLSILTDFEEFAVYDCRIKPVKTDSAATARIMYFTFTNYIDKWDELINIFSPEAIKKGSFDRFVESKKAKKGTAEVDDAFLQEIERWRDLLARNIALRNPDLSQRELNFAVQRTIDRIIFLRIAEDRGLEEYNTLRQLSEQPGVYDRLMIRFRHADDRYNSGLFHFKTEKEQSSDPDTLTPQLTIDDKTLKDILKNLYYPDSPYEFSVIPADILGQVYEQFLGKVIRLTAGHRAVVEDKPEVKKAGGVYYTPTYIVDYIVQNTVGRLLKGDTSPALPNDDAQNETLESKKCRGRSLTKKNPNLKLTILDPACGSGSFLLGAYQYLLDWYLAQYTADPDPWVTGKTPRLHQSQTGEWQLTIDERKRILLSHIYGVDIDQQAVEVTKLSLLLKVLEGENQQTIDQQMSLFQERVLPDLSHNIKCGNSLIGPDFYEGQLTFLDEEELYRINAFDWEAEFPDIFKDGGFDAVIGNPPYVRQELLKESKPYFQKHYESFQGTADLYVYFIEKSLRLLKPNGLFSIIVSKSFLYTSFANKLRKYLYEKYSILSFVDFGGLAVFEKAKDTYVCIPIFRQSNEQKSVKITLVESLTGPLFKNSFEVNSDRFSSGTWSLKNQKEIDLFEEVMSKGLSLKSFVNNKIFYGIKTGLNDAFLINSENANEICQENPKSAQFLHPYYSGQDIRRYYANENGKSLIVIPNGWTCRNYSFLKNNLNESAAWDIFSSDHPLLSEHLKQFLIKAKKRQDKGDFWWELRSCDYYQHLEKPKIIYPDIAKKPRFMLDESGAYISNTAYCLAYDSKYLLGFLNSKLFWFLIGNISIPFGTRAGQYRYRLIYQYMEKVPIRTINFDDPADVARHDQMVTLVQRMLDLHRQLAAASVPHTKTLLQRQITTTDKQIDQLVYELYDLTEEEIAIVEKV